MTRQNSFFDGVARRRKARRRQVIGWLIEQWRANPGLPKIRSEAVVEKIRTNKWIGLAVESLTREQMTTVLEHYAEIREDKEDKFFDGFKDWSLFELFTRKQGEYVEKLLMNRWEKYFVRRNRKYEIGESSFGGYTVKRKPAN